MKLILVDDNNRFRSAVKMYLEKEHGFEIIAEASDGDEFLKIPDIYKADIILMDLLMPNTDGFSAAKQILWKHSYLKIIAVTMHSDAAFLKELIEIGIKGCIFKNNFYDEIIEAITTVSEDNFYFPENIKIAGNEDDNRT